MAIGLADELSRLGGQSLLVDSDVYGGSAATSLGVLDESPGLAAACRHASNGKLDADALATYCWQLSPQLRLLTGIGLAQRWTEIRPRGLSEVLNAGRTLADFSVVDCGFNLETDEEVMFDSVTPRRNGATLSVLDDADAVVAVGSADPVGIQRLVRGLSELRDVEVSAPVWVVVNKVRRVVVPGDPDDEITTALLRFAGQRPAALLPYDREGLDVALAAGRTLGELRPNSPLRRAMIRLACSIAGRPQPSRERPLRGLLRRAAG